MVDRTTSKVKLITAVVGLITAVVTLAGTAATQVGAFGDARITWLPHVPPAAACPPAIQPSLSLSVGQGPSGTSVTVTGRDYCPGERVEIRLHTEDIGVAGADDDGNFSQVVTIPGSFDVFAPQQFHIVGTGVDSNRSARVPFRLTAAS
jgi:hypothetical protein